MTIQAQRIVIKCHLAERVGGQPVDNVPAAGLGSQNGACTGQHFQNI